MQFVQVGLSAVAEQEPPLNVPAGHTVQAVQTVAPASAKVPGRQEAHPPPGATAKPAGQKVFAMQASIEVLPAPVVVLPVGQAVQAEEPAEE